MRTRGDFASAGLLLFGTVGFILSALDRLQHIITLSTWSQYIVNHWSNWTAGAWDGLGLAIGLQIPRALQAGLTLTLLLYAIALGGRLMALLQGADINNEFALDGERRNELALETMSGWRLTYIF